jgi:hypothetical protein
MHRKSSMNIEAKIKGSIFPSSNAFEKVSHKLSIAAGVANADSG